MFRSLINLRYCGEHEIELLHGYQIFAVDGSDIALPDTSDLLEAFGGTGRNADSPTARASVLYDVLNDFIIDAAMEDMRVSERDLAVRHIHRLDTFCPQLKKLLIFDCGYPSSILLRELYEQSLHFLMRVRSKWDLAVDNASEPDSLVRLPDGLIVRVVKFQLPSGETETLITDLFELPIEAFPKLYFMRWPVETKYDILKKKLALENFSRTLKERDFTGILGLDASDQLGGGGSSRSQRQREDPGKRVGKDNKYLYVANLNQIIATLRYHLAASCFLTSKEERLRALDIMTDEIRKSVVPIRPGRSARRSPNPRKAKYHHNRKAPA